MYALMFHRNGWAAFCEVSVAIRWGVSGMKGLGIRLVTTSSMNCFGIQNAGIHHHRKAFPVAYHLHHFLKQRILHLIGQ